MPSPNSILTKYLYKRDGGKCRYCGEPGTENDHVNPKCNDGEDDPFNNLVRACRDCNETKGREAGFELRDGELYWQGLLVAPGRLYGPKLMELVQRQRLERQRAQGLTHIVEHKEGGTS